MKFICDTCGKPTDNEYRIEFGTMENEIIVHRCDECDKKNDAEIDWQNEQYGEDDIICPWCGTKFSGYEDMSEVTPEPYRDFEGTVDCPVCGKEFELEIETKCDYTTRKPSEQFNYEEWLQSESEE